MTEPKGRSVPAGDDDIQPLKLCKQDRRRFYGLLDADVPARLRRLEIAVYGLLATTLLRTFTGVPVEQLPAGLFHLIFG